jgi:hypothetical protein
MLVGRYALTWKMAFVVPTLLMVGWILLSPHERGLWRDYANMVNEQVKVHQDLPHPIQYNEPDPHFPVWEGYDISGRDSATRAEPTKIYSENGNVFVLFRNIFHHQLPVAVLEMISIAVILLLTVVYALQKPWLKPDMTRAAIFGFCIYMVSDLCSPIYRHQYYTVQWLMPLLLAAAIYRRQDNISYMLLLAALLLSSIHLSFIKMENTIGEYLFMLVLLWLGFPNSRKKLSTSSG